jgi:periplasmic divalent cation tolerance protein
MKIFYVTLNTESQAKTISYALLQKQYAVCTNWFPIQCAYRWEGEIKDEPEYVLVIKTKDGQRDKIERVIREHITFTNCIAEIGVDSINAGFLSWLNKEVG